MKTWKRCQSKSPRERYQCTQEVGHFGDHTAIPETGKAYTAATIRTREFPRPYLDKVEIGKVKP